MKFLLLYATVALCHPAMLMAEAGSSPECWPRDPNTLCEIKKFGDPLDLKSTGGEGIAIVIRFLDSTEMNQELVLIQTRSDDPKLRISSTVGSSFSEQLRQLRKDNPLATFDDVCSMVKTRSYSPGLGANKLREMVTRFRDISIHPTIDAPLVLHGTHYRVWIFSAPINHSYFDFYGAGPETAKDNPLQHWIDELAQIAVSDSK